MQTCKTICPYDCPTTCGLLATTDGAHVFSVQGDPDAPPPHGTPCRKMRRYEQSIHAPDRLLTPLKRIGDKGKGLFARISWEEAIGTIADTWKKTLREQGPEVILPFYHSGVMSLIQRNCGDALFHKMGACSLIKTLCASAKSAGYAAVMGNTGCLDPRELVDSDFHIVWGSNMKATRLQSLPDIITARRRGGRIVLIECYAGDMAAYCDQTVLITPGTDGALALAMMHVLVAEGLADFEFLQEQALGFEAFQASLAHCSPAWASGVTGVPAATIVALAREFGAASSPAIILGSGNSRYGNGGMTVRLITILSAFTGAWKRPGGGLCGCPHGGGPFVDMTRITRPDLRQNAARKVNINKLAAALRGGKGEPPIRCLHVYGSNPVASVCDQRGIERGLSAPGLFTVVHERFMTDTARYADIILPATFSVEHADCYASYGYRSFGTAYRVIPPAGECKSNWEIFSMLAGAMGYTDSHFNRNEDALLEELLAHPLAGLQEISEEQRRTLKHGGLISIPPADHTEWQTPSGKMEIVNPVLEMSLPRYLEPHGGAHPLKLVVAPSVETLNSIFLERKSLVARRGPMTLAIHPEDAAARGIVDGDAVTVMNDLGEVAFVARVTPLVARGAVAAAGVFEVAASSNGRLVNTLHHDRLSDIGEATTLNDNTVEVRRG